MDDPRSRLSIEVILKEIQELTFLEVAGKLAGKVENYDWSDFKGTELFANGGQSQVVKAYSERLKRTVALKLFDDSRAFRKGDVMEARFLATLSNSEHVVKLYGLMIEPLGLVLEYMEMGSLYDAIHSEGNFANNPLTYGLGRALTFMHNAACGIQKLHELGILHRDIKPGNLLLGKSLDDVKIADFGTAIFLSTETTTLSTKTFATRLDDVKRDLFLPHVDAPLITSTCGTPRYLAPENFFMTSYQCEKRDIYAFAITCWEILERRHPRGNKTYFTYKKVLRDRPKFEYNHIAVPYELEQLIKQGWDKNPKARPLIEKFVETIRHFLTTKTSRLNAALFQNCLKDFFSKMTKADFEKEMQRFKNYWSDHRVYYEQNKHYYERAGFIQDIVDKLSQTNYYDTSQKEKFSMHVFVPPGFNEKNKVALETTVRHWMTDARSSKKQGSDDNLDFLRVTVEGGDCFAVSAKYSDGVHGNDRIQKVLEMPYPGKGASSFPMVKEDKQLYPIPTRTIAVIGSLPAFWEFTSSRQFYNDDRGMTVINGERFNFFKFEPGNTEDVFKDWKKDTTVENKEFHLLCIVENTMEHQDDPAKYPKFEASYSRFREYCKSNKENLALLEFTNENTKHMLLQDNLTHIGLRVMYNEDQDGEQEKNAIMMELIKAARNASVVYL